VTVGKPLTEPKDITKNGHPVLTIVDETNLLITKWRPILREVHLQDQGPEQSFWDMVAHTLTVMQQLMLQEVRTFVCFSSFKMDFCSKS